MIQGILPGMRGQNIKPALFQALGHGFHKRHFIID